MRVMIILLVLGLGNPLAAQDFTPIIESIKAKDFEGFERLMQSTSFNVNSRNDIGATVLCWISGMAPVEYVQYLVEHGADINALIEKGDLAGYSATLVSAWGNNLPVLKYFQSKGVNLNNPSKKDGPSPMDVACMNGSLEVVQYLFPLIKNKSTSGFGMSYLAWALNHSNYNSAKVAKFLIDSGVDLNADRSGYFGMAHEAALNKYPEIFKLLLSKNVNWELKSQWGSTPIFNAVRQSINATSELLKKKVQIEDLYDYQNMSLLQVAIDRGNPFVVQLLIDAGASPVKINPRLKKSAIDLAREQGRTNILAILEGKKRLKMPAWTLDDEIATGLKIGYYDAGPLELVDLKGNKSQLKTQIRQVTVFNIWATWCPPCISEMPSLQALYTKYKARGLTVLGQSLDENPNDAATFAKENKLSFPLFTADFSFTNNSFKSPYPSYGIPTSYILDQNGLVVDTIEGSYDWLDPKMQRFVEMIFNSNQN